MIIRGIRGLFVGPKRRPKQYRAVDAPYPVGGNSGFYIASRPGAYPMTAQQRRVRDVARECGIHSGISKRELMTAMKECVGPHMRRGG
jgi:hypothetical protein